jgi:hypothetical protein
MVSDPYGFEDSPDAEVIASGLNCKGPYSIALSRHGNFFQWGFSAQPSDMTPEARNCFVNAVCYIQKFDGQKPLVLKDGQGREWALVLAEYVNLIKDEKVIEGLFPKDLYKRFGTDAEKYRKYYRENLEYLHAPERTSPALSAIVVDEDVKSLGLSNRKVELLDRCVSMLEKGEKAELSLRVLRRYTSESFADAKEWRAWLEESRGQLFFSDAGGFKFFVAPHRNP